MPITVNELVKEAGWNPKYLRKVKWGIPVSTQKEGVYIVSLSEISDVNNSLAEMPILMNILKERIDKIEGFTIDRSLTHDFELIKNRLSQFWLNDESILYIGKAPIRKRGKGLGNRIQEYYDTVFGEEKPHAGGHWIKTLSNLKDLYVYYIECSNSPIIENDMVTILEDGNKIKKKYGLGHMKK